MDNLPEPFKLLWKRSTEQLTEDESVALADLLHQYKDVFSLSEQDLARTNLIGHQIDTGNARSIKQKPRRTSPSKHAEIERQVEDLLQRGVVEKSNSPWSSPVVLVTKKDGSQRLCVDCRLVNAATVKDAYPVPRIDDSLSALSGAKWFSTLDLTSGYWHVPIDPASSGSYEIEYRAGQKHQKADALSLRPYNDGWCKERKRVGQMLTVAVQTDVPSVVYGEFVVEQGEARPDKQSET